METPQRLGGTELKKINAVTERIIGSAIEVHRILGPGLLESMYDAALCIELDDRGIKYARQVRIPAHYKGRSLGHYLIDFIVEDLVVVEIKSVSNTLPVYEAQLLTYMRLAAKRCRAADELQLTPSERRDPAARPVERRATPRSGVTGSKAP